MVKPASVFSNVTVAVVLMLSAVRPALPSCPESAIEKQPACAAAINSSGFVPLPSSNRVLNEYCVLLSTPLSVEIVPLPSFKPPCQTAEALRFICLSLKVDVSGKPALLFSFSRSLQGSRLLPQLTLQVRL